MRETTHRQYKAWVVFLREQWNNPDLTHYYLMSLICEVRRVLMKNPNSIKPEDFKIKFKTGSQANKPKMTVQEATALSKAKWLAMMTMPVTEVVVEKPVETNGETAN